jgi:hypothetical protein
MNLTDSGQVAAVQSTGDRSSYSAPRLKSVTPEAARKTLLRHSDANDPKIKFMLECIEQFQNPKGS